MKINSTFLSSLFFINIINKEKEVPGKDFRNKLYLLSNYNIRIYIYTVFQRWL